MARPGEIPDQNRHIGRWLASFQADYLLSAKRPWITFDAADCLEEFMQPGMRIFEWGSGGSTLFWLSKNAGEIVSIEHDPAWHAKLSPYLSEAPQVDFRLVPPEPLQGADDGRDPQDPEAYATDDRDWAACSFRTYASQIDAFPDRHFDVVMIDGRSRPSCIKHGAPKVRSGGLLVLDNADRSYYLSRASAYLTDFAGREFSGLAPAVSILCQTNIYIRMQ